MGQVERPQNVNIFGKQYSIVYYDKPSDVDIYGRKSLWGQVDYWTHTIRIYAPVGFSIGEIWDTIIHEVLHAIANELKLKINEDNDQIDLLALGLSDVLLRNGWLDRGCNTPTESTDE